MHEWKKTVGYKLRGMSQEKAREILAAISKPGPTIFHSEIRDLTGGLNSQSINSYVIRKLGIKAGYIKNTK